MGRHKKGDKASVPETKTSTTTETRTKKRVLELSDDEAEGSGQGAAPITKLSVNKAFAKAYHERNQVQELKRLAEKYGDSEDDDSEPSEGEDEDGILAADTANEFLEILPKIAAHDPSVTRKDAKFFEKFNAEVDSESEDSESKGAQNNKKVKEGKVTYKDLVREDILEKMKSGKADDEEEAVDEKKLKESKRKMKGTLSIAEEEKLAREEFLRAAKVSAVRHKKEAGQGHSDEDDDEDELELKKRAKSDAERAQEDNEYKQFLFEQKKKPAAEAKLLEKFWIEKSDADDKEKFLRDFIINKAWIDNDGQGVPTYDDLVADDEADGGADDAMDLEANVDEEDDALDDLQDNFEHAYNFRFEEPGGTEIVTHVRAQIESARAPDEKRKEKRQKRGEKKEREQKQRLDEKNRLQNLKKEEITSKLRQLQKVSGMSRDKVAALVNEDDFDPEAWDAQMSAVFDDAYYAEPDFEKPDFGGVDTRENDDAVTPNWEKEARRVVQRIKVSAPNDEAAQSEAQELEKALEDYYKMDYEDMVGGMPVRFKYTRVEPQSYGLNAVDILLGDDKQLNRFVPLKKIAPYREDQGKFKKSGKARGIKRKRSVQPDSNPEPGSSSIVRAAKAGQQIQNVEDEDDHLDSENAAAPKKKRRRRNKTDLNEGDS